MLFRSGVALQVERELAWLYANAALAVSLSLDEGFGMPATEAAHFDAPLVASDIPVFRETVGDYASFVPPCAPASEIAEVIDAAWGTPADGAEVRARYSWDAATTALRHAVTAAGQRESPRSSRT